MLILKSLRRLLVYIYIYKILGSFGTSGVSLKMVFRHGGGVAKQLDIKKHKDTYLDIWLRHKYLLCPGCSAA